METLDQGNTSAVVAELTLAPKINLADFQISVPAIRELAVFNSGEHEVQGLTLRLRSAPPFLRTKTWHLDSIGPGARYHIKDVDVLLDGPLLSRLTESEKATVTAETYPGEDDSAPITTTIAIVELLARNQWGGTGQLPEMVTAFVQPNDPFVDRVLKLAAGVLEANGKSSAIDGYTQEARRAWEIASAVWSAILRAQISWAPRIRIS